MSEETSRQYEHYHHRMYKHRWESLALEVYGIPPQNSGDAHWFPVIYSTAEIEFFLQLIAKSEMFESVIDNYLWKALGKYSIKDHEVAVMGSITAWYESNVIFYGGRPTTIEYNKRISKDSRLKTLKPSEITNEIFDSALSISSFEHDGLGAYGEPINENGDLETMQKMKSLIKKGGIMFLAVPVGNNDRIEGCTRIYGTRFKELIRGWEILDFYGECNDGEQPLFILKNL